MLRVLVLNNATVCTTLSSNGSLPDDAAQANELFQQTSTDNCLLYAIVNAGLTGGALSAASGCNAIDSHYDSTHNQFRGTCVTSSPQAAGTFVTYGFVYPSGTDTTIAGVEIDPSGGAITQDASTPAAVISDTATTATTASFNPPAGSLILVLAAVNGGASASSMTISSSVSLSWTLECITDFNSTNSPQGLLAGIWYAYVPAEPQITTQTLPGGATGQAYSFTMNATSGTPGYTWAVTSGSLPTGLSLSSAGVISGTPSATGVSPVTITVTDSLGFTAATAFSIVVNADSTPGGVVRATWALSAAPYSYGTLEVPVSTADHDWLFVSVSWMAGEDAGIAYVADGSHNLYQPQTPATSSQANTQVFVVPNARAASVIYVSTSAYVRWLNVQITEVTGLQPGLVIDASNVFTSGPATSLTESLSTLNPDFIFAVAALSGAPQTVSGSGSGVTWTGLTGSFNGSASAGITQAVAWAETTGSASPSLTFSGLSGYWSGVMIAVFTQGGLPPYSFTSLLLDEGMGAILDEGGNPLYDEGGFTGVANYAWPVISARAAFGYTPQQPTAPPVWTDITSRFLGLNGQRGRSFELDEIAAADLTCSFDNRDGALNPQNSASPFWPNVTLITPVEVLATWQGRTYVLFRGLITALPQTYDFQRGLVKAALSDDFSKLPQILLPTTFIQEMLYDNPLDLWALNDQTGAPFASNWSGRSNAELVPTVADSGAGSTISVIGGAAPPQVLTVTLFGFKFSVAQTTAPVSNGAVTGAGATTSTATGLPTTGFGNSQGGVYPTGLASTTDTVWGNTTTAPAFGSSSGYQATLLADSNDSTLPLTTTGATYAVWAQMLNVSINSSTGAMVMVLTDQNGTGGSKKYLEVFYNGTTVTLSQTSGSQTFTPSASLFDGKWHLWTVTISPAALVTFYLDGVALGSYTATMPAGTPTLLQFGGDSKVVSTGSPGLFTGYMTTAGVYDRVVDPERIATWFLAGSTGFLDEYAGTRIQRVLAWARWSMPQAVDTGLTRQQVFNYLTGGYASSGLSGSVGNYQTAGGSAAIDSGAQCDMALQDIANTDCGLLFLTAGGELFFRNKNNLSGFPAQAGLSDMDWPLNETYRFAAGLGEWTTAANCTLAESNAWSYCEEWSGLMTVTGTPSSASVTGGQWPIQGSQAGFSAWVMSPQGCYAQLSVNWWGMGYSDIYQANYTDHYGSGPAFGQLGTTTGTLTYLPPMTPVHLMIPATTAPAGTTEVQGVITIGSSPATGTELYFDRTRLSPAGFAVPYLNDSPGDLSVTEDIQYLYNDVAVTRNVDQVAIRTANQASRSRYYPRVYTRTIYSSADDPNALINCANTLLANFDTPQLRVQQVIVDAASNPEAWPFVLGTDIGDLVTFTRTPVGAPGVTGSFIVISVEPDIAPDKATFTYTLIPAGVF